MNDETEESTVYGAEDFERFFPGMVLHSDEGFTLDHSRLAERFVLGMKATTGLTKEEFLRNMAVAWDAFDVFPLTGRDIN